MRVYIVLALLTFTTSANAEYIEVRRQSSIFTEPTSASEVIQEIGPSESEPLVIVYLDMPDAREGDFLRVVVPTTGEIGFIPKTAGRVFKDTKGQFESYDRGKYRHWIDADRNCFDTRQEVLLRDDVSGSPTTKRSGSRCSVTVGEWDDLYTGDRLTDPGEIDIDHLVPLKNAHLSGAWAWSAEKKKEYANFLGNNFHLIAVLARENRRKSDKGPDKYMPPNEDGHCEYIANFLAVKLEWGLRVSADEMAKIDEVQASCPE